MLPIHTHIHTLHAQTVIYMYIYSVKWIHNADRGGLVRAVCLHLLYLLYLLYIYIFIRVRIEHNDIAYGATRLERIYDEFDVVEF